MQTARITLLVGLLVGRTNHPAGAEVEVDADRARSLVEAGHASRVPGTQAAGQGPRRPRTASAAPAGRTAAITAGRAAP